MKILFLSVYILSLSFIAACGELESDDSTKRISQKVDEYGLTGTYDLSEISCNKSDEAIKALLTGDTTMAIADDVLGIKVDTDDCEATYIYEITQLTEEVISATKRSAKLSDEEVCNAGPIGLTGRYSFENGVIRIDSEGGCAAYAKR